MDSKKVERFALYTGKSCCFSERGRKENICGYPREDFEETC